MSRDEENSYRFAMGELSDAIPVWPPVCEHTDAKKKVKGAYILDRISRELKHPRPNSYLLTNQKPPLNQLQAGMWVLKRDQSDSADGIKLPQDLQTFEKTVREELVHGQYPWLAQQYLSLLRDIGEWRCFVVGGHVKCVIFAYPDSTTKEMVIVPVEHFKSIGDMS